MKNNGPVTGNEIDFADVKLISQTDTKGVITYVNREFQLVSGYAREELIGQSHNIVRHPDMPTAAFKDMWNTLKSGRHWTGIVKNRAKNGDHYWVHAFVTPVYEDGNRLVGYQSVRTKPSREDVEEADALYRQLRQEGRKELPARRSLKDIKIKTAAQLGGIALALLWALAAAYAFFLNDKTGAHFRALSQSLSDPVALERISALQSSVQSFEMLVLIMGIAGAIFSVVFGWGVRRYISLPLEQAAAAFQAVSRGDLSRELHGGGRNELGEVLNAADAVRARLFTVLSMISESSSSLGSAVQQLIGSTQHAEASITSQQGEMAQVATAIEEMAATASEMARNTADGERLGSEAEDQAGEGKRESGEVRTQSEALVREIEANAREVTQVASEVEGISGVLKVIRDISEQTNLLALNAAIEAARAGDSGRGFAVVADEVRTLAGRTQEGVEQIEHSISQLTARASTAVSAMERNRDAAATTIETVEKAAALFERIADTVVELHNNFTQIATATEEQSAVSTQVAQSAQGVAELVHATSEDVSTVNGATGTLLSLVQDLDAVVRVFHMGKTDSLDLTFAKQAHLAWRMRLRNFLDGKGRLSREEAVDHTKCGFGKWLHGEGLRNYGHLKAMAALVEPHERMHALIYEIIVAREQGHIDEAERLFSQIDHISTDLVRLLGEAETESVLASRGA